MIGVYEFTTEEKTSMRVLVWPFLALGRYKSDEILGRIDEGKLNKRDLESIQKKLAMAIPGLNSITLDKAEMATRLEIAKHASIVDHALSRYRIISWK